MRPQNLFHESGTPVPSDELSILYQVTLPLIYWVREYSQIVEKTETPKTLLLSECDSDQKLNSLKQLLSALRVTDFRIQNNQLRFIFSQYPVEVWMNALKHIIFEATNPSIFPSSVVTELNSKFFNTKVHQETMLSQTASTLRKLGNKQTQILAEFFSLLRSTTGTNQDILDSVTDEVSIKTGLNQQSVFNLITHCDEIFGQSSCPEGLVNDGLRANEVPVQWELLQTLPEDKQHLQDLKHYYSVVDPDKVDIAGKLVSLFDWKDIAKALFEKYRSIPKPWHTALSKLLDQVNQGEHLIVLSSIHWFQQNDVPTPNPTATANQRVALFNKVQTERKPRARRATIYREPIELPELAYERRLYRIIDGEKDYYKFLIQVAENFVIALRQDLSSHGLNANQLINRLFGQRYENIMKFSEHFVLQLEPVSLVRGRPLLKNKSLIQEFCSIVINEFDTKLYKAYSYYFAGFEEAHNLVQNSTLGVRCHQVWFQTRHQISMFENANFKQILEVPYQRAKVYKTLLEKLLESVYADQIAGADIVVKAIKVVKSVLSQLENINVSQENMF
eukprot:maker-scaffold_2-snap-gene-8.32-mRNA-1 protein AED:0.01 eAED:0.01 QI:143/1/1/1/1/1/3/157/561